MCVGECMHECVHVYLCNFVYVFLYSCFQFRLIDRQIDGYSCVFIYRCSDQLQRKRERKVHFYLTLYLHVADCILVSV